MINNQQALFGMSAIMSFVGNNSLLSVTGDDTLLFLQSEPTLSQNLLHDPPLS